MIVEAEKYSLIAHTRVRNAISGGYFLITCSMSNHPEKGQSSEEKSEFQSDLMNGEVTAVRKTVTFHLLQNF